MIFNPEAVECKVSRTESHDSHSANSAGEVGGKAHAEREDSTAEETHNHQTGNLVLVVRVEEQCLREADGKDIAVAEAYQCNTRVENP